MHFKIETISALPTNISYRKLRLRADRACPPTTRPLRHSVYRLIVTRLAHLAIRPLLWLGSLTWLSGPCCSISHHHPPPPVPPTVVPPRLPNVSWPQATSLRLSAHGPGTVALIWSLALAIQVQVTSKRLPSCTSVTNGQLSTCALWTLSLREPTLNRRKFRIISQLMHLMTTLCPLRKP